MDVLHCLASSFLHLVDNYWRLLSDLSVTSLEVDEAPN